MSLRALVTLLVLVAAAFGSWYVSRQGTTGEDTASAGDTLFQGYYLKTARILGTAADGSLLYEIRAERAEQKDDQRVEFTDVSIRYSPESDIPWTVDADAATILAEDPRRVLLRGHVRAVSSDGFEGSDTEIRTPYLELDPDRFVAETDERVQIRIGSRSLTATGMQASLENNTLELKSNVSGKFVP